MSINPEQILQGVNEKDVKAWKSVYVSYYAALCAYANRLIKDVVVSEDLVQEVLCNVWRSDRKFEQVGDFTFYLYRAVYNQAMMHIRSLKCKEQHLRQMLRECQEEFSEEVFADTVCEELLRQLYRYINELPEDRRKIMLLSIKGFSGQEIADQLGITIHTVKTQKNRSFKFLREKLKDSVFFILLTYYV